MDSINENKFEDDEIFEIYNESGSAAGKKSRKEVHRKGYWHKAVNIIVQRSSGNILIQQRSSAKDIFPDAWDFSVCEHLKPGEDFSQAAERGLREELGILDCPVELVSDIIQSKVYVPELGISDNEMQLCFLTKYDGPVSLCQEEVAAVEEIAVTELLEKIRLNQILITPWFKNFIRQSHYFSKL